MPTPLTIYFLPNSTLSPGMIFVPEKITIMPVLNALPPVGVYVFLPMISLSIAIAFDIPDAVMPIALGPAGLQKYSL